MSALHEAVARAIADNCWRVVDASDGHPSLVEDVEGAAAAAIGVVLAEATQSIEALRVPNTREGNWTGGPDYNDALDDALAALRGERRAW